MSSHRHGPVALLVLTLASPLAGQEPSPLHELGFLSGCWRGATATGSIVEEQFTTPSNNLILGLTRYLRDGLTRGFEFHMIGNVAGGSHLVPHPGGRASVTFVERERGGRRVVWENPEHDFPQRISYAGPTPDSLVARIELLDGTRATEYRMARAACPG